MHVSGNQLTGESTTGVASHQLIGKYIQASQGACISASLLLKVQENPLVPPPLKPSIKATASIVLLQRQINPTHSAEARLG